MKTTVYLHASKESMRDEGEKLGLSGDALDMFAYACYEVAINLDVSKTGKATITHVDGREVAP
jgi:hypothetical protein